MDSIFAAQGIDTSKPQGQQNTTGTATSNLAPWAQPYVSNYLNRAQDLVANQQTPGLLNQSYVGAAGLQLPGGFASGSALAQAGGQGSLSTAPIALDYGQRGFQYGAEAPKYGAVGASMGTAASRAGDMYTQQATSPEAMAQYMSPYMNNVVDWQKQQAIRDYQIQAPQMAAQSVGAGAFGGNRLALQQAEANRGLQNRLSGIEATGQQQAYQNAQQAQQFGSSLGLQGLQAGMQGQQVGIQGLQGAMQGAGLGLQGVQGAQQGYAGATTAGGTLGNIAAQQNAARIANLQLQNQFLQSSLSNLPFTSTAQTGTGTQQGFTAPPNYISQIGGLGTAGLGIFGLGKATGLFADGGQVKNYAQGGLINSGLNDIRLHQLLG